MLFVVGVLGLIAYSTLNGPRYRVKVCMAFNGSSACKTVHAKSEAGALRSATENACADIAAGVAETMRCQQTDPQSVRWLEKPH